MSPHPRPVRAASLRCAGGGGTASALFPTREFTLSDAAQSQPSHRAFAALRQPGYAVYLTGTMLAMMADSIEHVISYWVIYEKFKSPALGGYAVISHWAPFLFF